MDGLEGGMKNLRYEWVERSEADSRKLTDLGDWTEDMLHEWVGRCEEGVWGA